MTSSTIRPNVLIVNVSGGELTLTAAYPASVDSWRYADLGKRPESDLPALKLEAAQAGALVVDKRTLIEQNTPGLTATMPVLICYRIPLWHALKAVERLDRAAAIVAGRRNEGQAKRRVNG